MSTSSPNKSGASVSAEEVADYLRLHPNFFSDHLGLLEFLKIPHPSGQAVSLVSRQLDLLRDRNERLQQQFDELVQIARENDALYERMHQLILTLLDAASFDEMLTNLISGMMSGFQADFVAVRIVTPTVTGLAQELIIEPDSFGMALCDQVLLSGKPLCGHPKEEQKTALFGENAGRVASQVVLPLNHNGLCGLFAIGSRDSERFCPGMDFALLSRLSEVLAARILAMLPAPAET